MRRPLTRPRNPEGVALALLALRRYASGKKGKSTFDSETAKALSDRGVSRHAAKRLVDRFDQVRPAAREEVFGPLGSPTAEPPDREAPRNPPVSGTPSITLPSSVLGDIEVLDGPDLVLGEGGVPVPAVHTIRYKGLYCGGETGDRNPFGFTGFGISDEIYVVTSAVNISADPDAENVVRTERHPVAASDDYYGDVDKYEPRIGPVAACWSGTLRPGRPSTDVVSLTAVAFEHDDGDPDYYRDDVDTFVNALLVYLAWQFPAASPIFVAAYVSDALTDSIVWALGSADDLISTETVNLMLPTMEVYSSSRLDQLSETRPVVVGGFPPRIEWEQFATGLMYHFVTRHRGEGADYVVGFDVTRDPPFDLDLTDPLPEVE